MTLSESKATIVLNTYLKFCNILQKDGEITDKNFNRIRVIDGCIGDKREIIKKIWGDLFDEIYFLLDKPAIKAILDEEKYKIQQIREQKKINTQKSLLTKQLKNNTFKTKQTVIKRQKDIRKPDKSNPLKKEIKQKSISKDIGQTTIIKSQTISHQSQLSNQKRKAQKSNKPPRRCYQCNCLIRDDVWQGHLDLHQELLIGFKDNQKQNILVTREILSNSSSKHTKENKKNQGEQTKNIHVTFTGFEDYDSSIMDERKAEGKGYSGSK